MVNRSENRDLVPELRRMYLDDPAARRFWDWAAARVNDAAETSIDRIMSVAQIDRSEAVELGRRFDDAGVGEFIVGRKGWKSRVRWARSLCGLGKAAQGQVEQVDDVDPELVEESADHHLFPSDPDEAVGKPLTIMEAKRGLAAKFGVSPDKIEIIIRA